MSERWHFPLPIYKCILKRKCFLFFFPGNAERKIKSLVCMYFDCLVQFACVIIASTGHGSLVFFQVIKQWIIYSVIKVRILAHVFLQGVFRIDTSNLFLQWFQSSTPFAVWLIERCFFYKIFITSCLYCPLKKVLPKK